MSTQPEDDGTVNFNDRQLAAEQPTEKFKEVPIVQPPDDDDYPGPRGAFGPGPEDDDDDDEGVDPRRLFNGGGIIDQNEDLKDK